MGWGRKPGDQLKLKCGRRRRGGTRTTGRRGTHTTRRGAPDDQGGCGPAAGAACTATGNWHGCAGAPGSDGEALLPYWPVVLTCKLCGEPTELPIAVAGVAIPAGLGIGRGKEKKVLISLNYIITQVYYRFCLVTWINWPKFLDALCYFQL